MTDWRHCTTDPPVAGFNYFILELTESGVWRHTVDHYGYEESSHFAVWMSGKDREHSWWIEVPEPYPDPASVTQLDEVSAEA